MKKITSIGVIFLILLFSLACSDSNLPETHPVYGDLAFFEVNKKYCKKTQLPKTNFSIKYPKSMLVDSAVYGEKNLSYLLLTSPNKDKNIIESLSLGYCTITQKTILKSVLQLNLLDQFTNNLEELGFELSDVKKGRTKIDNKDYYILRAKGSISDESDKTETYYSGNYLIQIVITISDSKRDNGIFFVMMANEESDEVKTFKDFTDKGKMSVVWKSLKWE
jgi:hypothetical protein